MRAISAFALLPALLLGACAELSDTAALQPAENAGYSYAEPAPGPCGACGYGGVAVWHARRPILGPTEGHVHRPPDRHPRHHDRDRPSGRDGARHAQASAGAMVT